MASIYRVAVRSVSGDHEWTGDIAASSAMIACAIGEQLAAEKFDGDMSNINGWFAYRCYAQTAAEFHGWTEV